MRAEVNHFRMPNGEIVNLEDWNLIADITTEEEATALEVTQKQGGGSFELEEFVMVIKSVGTSSNTASNKNAVLSISGYKTGYFPRIAYDNGVTRTWVIKGNVSPILFLTGAEYNIYANYYSGNPSNGFGGYDYSGRFDKVTSVKVTMQASVFGAGSRMIMYGR